MKGVHDWRAMHGELERGLRSFLTGLRDEFFSFFFLFFKKKFPQGMHEVGGDAGAFKVTPSRQLPR